MNAGRMAALSNWCTRIVNRIYVLLGNDLEQGINRQVSSFISRPAEVHDLRTNIMRYPGI
jgi:hypothetical protein